MTMTQSLLLQMMSSWGLDAFLGTRRGLSLVTDTYSPLVINKIKMLKDVGMVMPKITKTRCTIQLKARDDGMQQYNTCNLNYRGS